MKKRLPTFRPPLAAPLLAVIAHTAPAAPAPAVTLTPSTGSGPGAIFSPEGPVYRHLRYA